MAHHKSTLRANIITVRYGNNTYTARLDGEKASSTAGAEQAARSLAYRLFGVAHADVKLESVPSQERGVYKYRVFP